MTCNEFEELMTAYLEGELPDDKRESFEHHIGSCEKCQAEMSAYENCTRIFQKYAKDENPPETLRIAVFEKCCCEDPSKCCPPHKSDE